MFHVKRSPVRSRRLFAIALLGLLPLLAACTISNDPDGWAPPLLAKVDGEQVIIARLSDASLGAIDLSRRDPIVWAFPGIPSGQSTIEDSDRPFPGLTEETEAKGFYGVPVAIGAQAEELVIADHNEGVVFAVRRDGTSARILLETEDRVIAGLVVADDARTLYVATTDERVYAIDTEDPPADIDDVEGFVWIADQIRGRVWGTPALADTEAHGTVLIIPTMAGDVTALRADTGAVAWNFNSGSGIASDVVASEGIAYLGGFDQRFYAIDTETGDLRWSRRGLNWFWTKALVADGMVYAGDLDGNIWAWDAQSGALVWEAPFATEERIRAAPTLTPAGELVIVTREGTLLAADPATGERIWGDPETPLQTSNLVLANPILLDDGSLVISDDQGVLWRTRVGAGRVCQIFPERNSDCERLLDADAG